MALLLLSRGHRGLDRRRHMFDGGAAAGGILLGAVCAVMIMMYKHAAGDLPLPNVSFAPPPPGALLAQLRTSIVQRHTLAGNSGKSVVQAVTAAAAAAADAIDRLMDVSSLPHLFLSYGNAAYFEFVQNWAASMERIGATHVIAAFDDAMLALCTQERLPCVSAQFATTNDFRSDFIAFRAMGAIKVRLALMILERHPQLPLLVVSDSDTVWLRQPWAYFKQRPAADFFISTDCLSHQTEEDWQPAHENESCGHVPGNAGLTFNTGLFAVRNRPASRSFLHAWATMLTDSEQQRDSDRTKRRIDDQLALNLLLDVVLVSALGPSEPRVGLMFNNALRVQALPVALFPGGHVAFVQRTPWKLGVEPIAIHLTWQRWSRAGKVARLREFGLWHIDPPEYYGSAAPLHARSGSSSSGINAGGALQASVNLKVLTYHNDVLAFVKRVAAQRYEGGRMPLLYMHWLGMSYQLAAFRDALAAATMLGRAVVLPKLWCWCDFDEVPDSGILETCRINAGDYELPFQCPLDFLLPIATLDNLRLKKQIDYRLAGFLELPQLPPAVRNSRSVLNIAPRQPPGPHPVAQATMGHAATVWTGISQASLVAAALPLAETAVLELRGEVPGLIGSFANPLAAAAFDQMFDRVLVETFWCCFTWGDEDEEYRTLPYAVPQPFALAEAERCPWQAPVLQVPAWCDKVSTADGNDKFTRLPQHPCAFLRDLKAAELAAAGQRSTR